MTHFESSTVRVYADGLMICNLNTKVVFFHQKEQMDRGAGDSTASTQHLSSGISNQRTHPSDKKHNRNHHNFHKVSGDQNNDIDYHQDRRNERDHRSCRAGQELISLKEEMRKESLLITVPCQLPTSDNVRVKERVKNTKLEGPDCKVKSSKESRKRTKQKDAGGSDNDKGNTFKAKLSKKKKEKKKKKKERKDKSQL